MTTSVNLMPVTLKPVMLNRASSQTGTIRSGFTFVELVVVITVIAALAAIGFPVFRSVKKASDVSATQSMVQAVATAMSTYQLKTWTWETKAAGPSTPAEMRTYHLWDLNHFNKSGIDQPDIKMGMSPEGTPSQPRFFSIDGYTPGSKSYHKKNKTEQQALFDLASKILPTENWEKPDTTHGTGKDGKPQWDGNFPPQVIKSGYTGFMNMVAPTIHKKFVHTNGIIRDAWEQPLRITSGAKLFGTDSFGIWSSGYDKWDQTFRDDFKKYDENADDLRSWR